MPHRPGRHTGTSRYSARVLPKPGDRAPSLTLSPSSSFSPNRLGASLPFSLLFCLFPQPLPPSWALAPGRPAPLDCPSQFLPHEASPGAYKTRAFSIFLSFFARLPSTTPLPHPHQGRRPSPSSAVACAGGAGKRKEPKRTPGRPILALPLFFPNRALSVPCCPAVVTPRCDSVRAANARFLVCR